MHGLFIYLILDSLTFKILLVFKFAQNTASVPNPSPLF
ncbi:MAG: hypothetical protein ACI9LN_004757, partial [Saprospiraceae bacterium]